MSQTKTVSTTDDSQIDSDMEVDETDTHDTSQPEWMDLIQPNNIYAEVNHDFEFNDGGPDYNWSSTLYDYPHGNGNSWLDKQINKITATMTRRCSQLH